MAIRDLKSKVERLENLLNVKEDTPAPWAIEDVRFSMETLTPRPHTEEDIDREALELTKKYGTRENYEKAFLERCRIIESGGPLSEFFRDFVWFKIQFYKVFQELTGQCDICEAALDEDADFCEGCREKYPEKIEEIREYRMAREEA
jgi:hypothetical protein